MKLKELFSQSTTELITSGIRNQNNCWGGQQTISDENRSLVNKVVVEINK